MNGPAPQSDLGQLQRWMQAVIMHPDGVVAGMNSPSARQEMDVPSEHIERVICPSQNLSSIERLHIYASAYYARLLECLREEFPAMVHALGEQMFDGFAFGYLQQYPSCSYTLSELGRNFPAFLRQTRPDGDGSELWPDFLIDLATLERTYREVFDGPGSEGQRTLQPEDVSAVTAEQWARARLVPAACLRLLTLRFPVHQYASAVRSQKTATMVPPSPTFLVITRREYVVRRCAVSPEEYKCLSALVERKNVGEAIEQLADSCDMELEALASIVRTWFCQWARAGYFERIEVGADYE